MPQNSKPLNSLRIIDPDASVFIESQRVKKKVYSMLHQWFFAVFSLIIFSSSVSAQVVAKVGNKPITLKDFKIKYDEVKKQTINPPPPVVFLEDLIRYEVGVQEAEKQNLRNQQNC